MANWCWARHMFTGPEEEVCDLRDRITEYTSGPRVEDAWLTNVVEGFGFSRDDVTCRGYLLDKVDDLGSAGGEKQISIDVDTAWAPCGEMWDMIIAEHYSRGGVPKIRHDYIAEEPGSGIYVKTSDVFPEKYMLEKAKRNREGVIVEHADREWLCNDAEAVEAVNEMFRDLGEKTVVKTVEEARIRINMFCKLHGCTIELHKFAIV